jgi:hypothetical protein
VQRHLTTRYALMPDCRRRGHHAYWCRSNVVSSLAHKTGAVSSPGKIVRTERALAESTHFIACTIGEHKMYTRLASLTPPQLACCLSQPQAQEGQRLLSYNSCNNPSKLTYNSRYNPPLTCSATPLRWGAGPMALML